MNKLNPIMNLARSLVTQLAATHGKFFPISVVNTNTRLPLLLLSGFHQDQRNNDFTSTRNPPSLSRRTWKPLLKGIPFFARYNPLGWTPTKRWEATKSHFSTAQCLDPDLRTIEESPTLGAQRIVSARREAGLPVYNWGLGASPFPLPEALVNALAENAYRKNYGQAEGILELRKAIASHYHSEAFPVTENDIIVHQLKDLLFLVQLVFEGEIIHVTPFWPSYKEQTNLLKKRPVVIQTKEENNFKLRPEDVTKLCRYDSNKPRLLLFNNPVNPTGVAYTKEELQDLAIVFQKYQIIVVSDEVYRLVSHDMKELPSIINYHPLSIAASSLSKGYHAGGWRLGWMAFSPPLGPIRELMTKIGSSTYSCAPIPQQHAAIMVFQNNEEIQDSLLRAQYLFGKIKEQCVSRIREIGLDCIDAQAAWYLLISFNNYKKPLKRLGVEESQDLVKLLIEKTGIVFVAGEDFGLPKEELYVRAAFVDFSGKDALKSLESIHTKELSEAQISMSWANSIFESLDVLGDWLKSLMPEDIPEIADGPADAPKEMS
ncbi:MAG: pyridoxal phosphate-dependent aminotransferase [Waddliaceae bacterium]